MPASLAALALPCAVSVTAWACSVAAVTETRAPVDSTGATTFAYPACPALFGWNESSTGQVRLLIHGDEEHTAWPVNVGRGSTNGSPAALAAVAVTLSSRSAVALSRVISAPEKNVSRWQSVPLNSRG